ncbi:8-oxo-dGTP pyrophosphatase MutT (NUDIX family) [Sphingomonas sp. F9_3S_D5_B_2]
MPDEAIPAATLIIVREAPGRKPELLMVERSRGMAFAAGALVFPGGRIDAADEALAGALGASAAAVAAIRETIEETAVPVGIAPQPDASLARDMQSALVADGGFADVLRDNGVRLDPAALVPFARWVPKFHAVRRFDTMFFVARAPDGEWVPNVNAGECAGASWLPAAEVLQREQRGKARLIFPTRRTLERLAQHASFDEIRTDAEAHAIEPISPWVEEKDNERFITIPGDLGYPVTQERLDGLWRG